MAEIMNAAAALGAVVLREPNTPGPTGGGTEVVADTAPYPPQSPNHAVDIAVQKRRIGFEDRTVPPDRREVLSAMRTIEPFIHPGRIDAVRRLGASTFVSVALQSRAAPAMRKLCLRKRQTVPPEWQVKPGPALPARWFARKERTCRA